MGKEFVKECQMVQKLRHPNIVLFMGSCMSEKRLCMVTELMTRGSAFYLYHNKKKPSSQHQHFELALRICADACRGLAYLHSSKPPLVHRDVKSANILIDEHWISKIGDFGMTRFTDGTRTMTRCGSPLWAAPEVLRGERFDHTCDIYSMSIVLFELFTWSEPFKGMGANEVINMVAKQGMRPELPTLVPSNVQKLVNDMWVTNATVRQLSNYYIFHVFIISILITIWLSGYSSNGPHLRKFCKD